MTRPEDLAPPPAERLPDGRKQEMRQQLLAAATPSAPASSGSWLFPGLAAAAVLAIAGVGVAVAGHDGSGDRGSSGLAPAGQGGPAVTPGHTTATAPQSPGTVTPPSTRPGSSVSATRTAPPPPPGTGVPTGHGQGVDTTTCQQEIDLLAEPALDGATVTAERDYGAGVTSLFETKSAWIVCDSWAALDGGAPTLFAPHLKTETYEPSVTTLSLSMNFTMDDPSAAEYVAGGRDFDGVQAIAYTFPDGHEGRGSGAERAVVDGVLAEQWTARRSADERAGPGPGDRRGHVHQR